MLQECNLQWRYEDTDWGLIAAWYTLPCLEFLKKIDFKDNDIFEYGTGYSTPWWTVNAKTVISIDHDEKWAKAFNAIWLKNKDEYIEAPAIFDHKFDVIVIDGVFREECVKFCIQEQNCLRSKGMLIIDNYDSENYNIIETQELLSTFTQLTFKQPNHSHWITAIFIKP